jgi:prepilin-type N-terminal cleavage/methylation domain-containing protein
MRRSKNAGFTLIELAIVLVVIGLIIAAVLKGEDLIQNARMLNFVANPVQKAQVAAMSYYDRTGQFPSVVTATTTGGTTTYGPLYQMYQAGINGVLDIANPFTKGANNFAVALGFLSNNGVNYPVIVIKPVNVNASGVPTGARNWTQSDVAYVNYLKSRIDGGSANNWKTGNVRIINANIGLTYGANTSLATEIGGNIQTNAYDVRIGNTGVYTNNTSLFSSICVDPNSTSIVGTSDTLVYFYNQQPTN